MAAEFIAKIRTLTMVMVRNSCATWGRQWSLEDANACVFEVGQVSAFCQEAHHLAEDRPDHDRWEVVEWKPADHVMELRFQWGLFDRRFVQFHMNVGICLTERAKQVLLEVPAEGGVDFHEMEFVTGPKVVQDHPGEWPGAGADFENPSGITLLTKRPGHRSGELSR